MFPSQESLILGCRSIFICVWNNHSGGLILGCELYLSACGVTIQEALCSATPSPQRHTNKYKVRCEGNKKELQQGWNLELSSEVGSPEKLREGIRSYRFLR